jgi:hypothetical protein
MRRPALAVVALLAALPASASARPDDLWTTVNACNPAANPNTMGVRGRMPGDGTRERMYMRFAAQFRGSDGAWHYVDGDGRSGWMYAGSARFSYQEAGFTFTFDPPQAGDRFLFRGVADFQWRLRKRVHHKLRTVVVDHARLVTEPGHPSSQADPPGYSAASCEIDGPAG